MHMIFYSRQRREAVSTTKGNCFFEMYKVFLRSCAAHAGSLIELLLIVALIAKFLSKASINKFRSSELKAFVCNFKPLPRFSGKPTIIHYPKAKLTGVKSSAILVGMILLPLT